METETSSELPLSPSRRRDPPLSWLLFLKRGGRESRWISVRLKGERNKMGQKCAASNGATSSEVLNEDSRFLSSPLRSESVSLPRNDLYRIIRPRP